MFFLVNLFNDFINKGTYSKPTNFLVFAVRVGDSSTPSVRVTMNEQGVALVSGASPRVFSMVKAGNLTPMAFMLDTLNSERYAKIQA